MGEVAFEFKEAGIGVEDITNEAKNLSMVTDPLDSYEYLRIKEDTNIKPPVPVITINGEIISTECNITTISGASKSGKSAFTSIIIAGAISTNGVIDGLNDLSVLPNVNRKAVLHFDTEQARHKHQSNLKSIFKRAGLDGCPSYFLSYNIRELEIENYGATTAAICDAANAKHNGVHLIVIDGIADFINDVNDVAQANSIVKFFEDLAIKNECPVIVIVHTNPGSDKERGHLGSQCQRKSESVISVKSENDISFIEPKFLRMAGIGSIPTLQFSYDKSKGYHSDAGIKRPSAEIKQEQRNNQIKELSTKVYGGQRSYTYGEAIKALKEETGKSEAPVKSIQKEMVELNLIIKGEDNRYRLV